MKLCRLGPAGQERPALLAADGSMFDLSPITADITPTFLSEGLQQLLANGVPQGLPRVNAVGRHGMPWTGCGKVLCIGLNYRDHAREAGMQEPGEPVLFMKSTTALCGPNDAIRMPRGATKVDWEVELGVVIGKIARYVAREDALAHVAGFCVVNDLSERAFQLERGGQWVKGKSCDTFGPAGPWLVTPDELDAGNLDLWLDVNGTAKQRGSTRHMIFDVPHLVAYVSRFMTLMPGDLISTGTPAGVGMGFKPPQFLGPGDEVRLGIAGLGEQRQVVVAADAP